MSENAMVEQLADKVVGNVVKSGVREDILDVLLKAVQNNVREATVEALLVAVGHAGIQRDKDWIRQLQGEWSPKSGLKTATSPAEVEQEIRQWMSGRISETRVGAFKAGYEDGYQAALKEGAKFGWAAKEAGKGLEEVLTRVETMRPK